MQKIQNIDKKIPAATRVAGYILNIKASNSGDSGFANLWKKDKAAKYTNNFYLLKNDEIPWSLQGIFRRNR